MIKAVFFDFDGTLADTAPDMVAALNHWLAARHKPAVQLSAARHVCSGGSRALLSLRGWDDEPYEDAARDYLRRYENTGYTQTALFPGVPDMLTALPDSLLHWGIITNKPRRYFAPIAARLRLAEKNPAVMICGDDLEHAKPHPLPLFDAARRCRLTPEECVYVGDDRRDAQAAQAAGMPFIAVTWGYWQRAQWLDEPALPVAAVVSAPDLLIKILSALPSD